MQEEIEQIDITKLKYVLYVRKSTADEKGQFRSVDDQIAECLELAKRLKLHIVGEPLIEKRSAKIPNNRPIFNQMLKDIKKGMYDGILAWNPDRLARNMLEGGMLINMVDDKILVDLKFVTHHFTKDANGKMLLGMAFVLSKQYSDDLSQKVTRGVRRSFAEGKSGIPKYGYIRDEDGIYLPDGNNFEVVCEAWQMRKDGYTYEDIVKHMKERGFFRLVKSTKKKQYMTKQKLTVMFQDPFYYGILAQANQIVDLRTIYKFSTATTENDFMAIQRMSNKRPKYQSHKAFYPLKKMIICCFCNNVMYVAPSTSQSGKKYLNARCDTDGCTRKKRSLRARFIFDFVYKFLEKGLNLTEKEYEEYRHSMTAVSGIKQEKMRIQLHTAQGQLKQTKSELGRRGLKILDYDKSSTIHRVNEEKIIELQEEVNNLEDEIKKLKETLGKAEADILSIEEFLNFSEQASTKLQAGNAIVKDQICRKVFLNFIVDEEKVLSYQLKPPFDTLLKSREILPGRDGET